MRPFKFVVQAHLLEEDEDGKITGEAQSDPIVLYGEKLAEVAKEADMQILEALSKLNGKL